MATSYEGRKLSRKERRQMQQESIRNWECERKATHASKEAAMIAVRKAHQGQNKRPYQCTHCGQWHVGRKLTKSGRAKERRYRG